MTALARVLSLLAPSFCWACGAESGDELCRGCRLDLRHLGPELVSLDGVLAWAPLAYEGPAGALVRALKYRGAADLAPTLAARIHACAPPGLLEPGRALVPVPLHPRRRRRRGYNQSGLIAAELARRSGAVVADPLVRRGPATRQVGRDRAHRLAGIAGSIEVRRMAIPRRVVLVDDVITTGATLRACAQALRTAGAVEVVGVAFARTPGR